MALRALATTTSHVQLPLSDYDKLRTAAAEKQPLDHAFSAITALVVEGTVTPGDSAALKISSTIMNLGGGLREVPLLSTDCGVRSAVVKPQTKQPDTLHCVSVIGGRLCAVLEGRGAFDVECLVDVPLGPVSGKQGFRLSEVPKAVSTRLLLRFPVDDIAVKVGGVGVAVSARDGNTFVDAYLPPASQLAVTWASAAALERAEQAQKAEAERNAEAEQRAKDLEREVQEAAVVVKKPPRVTCSQFAVFSVGETHVMLHASLRFLMENTARKVLRVAVPDRLRIVSCTADGEALHDWTLLEGGASSSAAQRVLEASFDYERSERTVLLVVAEIELPRPPAASGGAATAKERSEQKSSPPAVALPLLTTVETNRELAHVAIEAGSNVEVNEALARGLSPLDPSELPKELKERSPNPLLAYKSLEPRSAQLSMSIRKHADTEVLVTTIDEGHYESTVAQEGQVLTRCLLKVRNTQRQFLRVTLPEGAAIWSTLVAGVPIKPGIDASSGQFMIALKKSGARRRDEEFVVELLYLTQLPPPPAAKAKVSGMQKRGRLQLAFPSFDIPVNHLFCTVRLPRNFKYGEFSGTLKESPGNRFTRQPTVHPLVEDDFVDEDDYPRAAGGVLARRGWGGAQYLNSHDRAARGGHIKSSLANRLANRRGVCGGGLQRRGGDISPALSISRSPSFERPGARADSVDVLCSATDDEAGDGAAPAADAKLVGAKKAGVTPVRAALPIVGQPFCFEKLLVVTDDALTVVVSYRERSKGCFARRNLLC